MLPLASAHRLRCRARRQRLPRIICRRTASWSRCSPSSTLPGLRNERCNRCSPSTIGRNPLQVPGKEDLLGRKCRCFRTGRIRSQGSLRRLRCRCRRAGCKTPSSHPGSWLARSTKGISVAPDRVPSPGPAPGTATLRARRRSPRQARSLPGFLLRYRSSAGPSQQREPRPASSYMLSSLSPFWLNGCQATAKKERCARPSLASRCRQP